MNIQALCITSIFFNQMLCAGRGWGGGGGVLTGGTSLMHVWYSFYIPSSNRLHMLYNYFKVIAC